MRSYKLYIIKIPKLYILNKFGLLFMNLLFEKFGIETENEHIYQVAFTHSSYSTYNGLEYNYERLEFLGDSVLSLLVSEYLYEKYPQYEEGKLTKLRANYVCQNALIYYSHELGLRRIILKWIWKIHF